MKLIGYTRVSTEEQATSALSLDSQRRKIERYCDVYGHELVDVIEDAGISAKTVNRPGFLRLMERLAGADGVVFVKLDRLFRSVRDAAVVGDKLAADGKAIVSIDEQLDTKSAIGRFFFNITAAFAQMERELCGERTKAALAELKERGVKLGRPSSIPRKTVETAWMLRNLGRGDGKPMTWEEVADEVARQRLGRYNKGSLFRAVKALEREVDEG